MPSPKRIQKTPRRPTCSLSIQHLRTEESKHPQAQLTPRHFKTPLTQVHALSVTLSLHLPFCEPFDNPSFNKLQLHQTFHASQHPSIPSPISVSPPEVHPTSLQLAPPFGPQALHFLLSAQRHTKNIAPAIPDHPPDIRGTTQPYTVYFMRLRKIKPHQFKF